MAEITFADGTQVVDDVFVEPINRATDGAPERFPFKVVMDRVTDFVAKDHLRKVQQDVIREHFRQWG